MKIMTTNDVPMDIHGQVRRPDNAVLIVGLVAVMVVSLVAMLVTGTAFGLMLRRLQARSSPNKNA